MTSVRAHVLISGRVQGVFFRAYTQEEARALGLAGWVRNVYGERMKMPSGAVSDFTGVEAVFEGEKERVNEMIAWCWSGSPSAKVTDVKVVWEDPQGIQGFQIRR